MQTENHVTHKERTAGEWTARLGKKLHDELKPKGYRVICSHGTKGDDVGQITSWFEGDRPHRDNRLSFPDIAIIEEKVGCRVLVEIEETSNKPKTLLGDIFGLLLGDHVGFGKEEPFKIGVWTTLIVMTSGADNLRNRIGSLSERVEKVRSQMHTPNAKIRKVVMDSFMTEDDLESKLRRHIEKALMPDRPAQTPERRLAE